MITISITEQTLTFEGKKYFISSAKNGIGEVSGSFCTPTGKFKISEKIGQGLAVGSVLVGRVASNEIYSEKLKQQYLGRDWILTRILWLDGVEKHNQNTKSRYIYIHGSPDETPMGVVGSKGCIRMHNPDIISLFNRVKTGENVTII